MNKQKKLKATVADRGQVTIPKPLRDKLGIASGTVVVFELRNGKLFLTKEIAGDPVALVYGCLKDRTSFDSTDSYINEIRGKAE